MSTKENDQAIEMLVKVFGDMSASMWLNTPHLYFKCTPTELLLSKDRDKRLEVIRYIQDMIDRGE